MVTNEKKRTYTYTNPKTGKTLEVNIDPTENTGLYRAVPTQTDYSGAIKGIVEGAKAATAIKPNITPQNPYGGYNYTPYAGGYKPSQAVTDAMAYTNSLLEQLSSGRTSFSDKLDAIMGKIENRPEFSYDFNTDPLFQNALASAMASGQTAMQDTIGQASALTGGYGSSYATSAANQAYNNSLKGAYDSLPQYYNIARDAYDREGDALYNQLGMYRAADESEYGRLNNAYNLNLNAANTMYDRENSEYWNTLNYNRQVANSNADLAYKYAALDREQKRYDAEIKRQDAQFDAEMAYKYAALDSKNANNSAYTEPSTSQMDKALKAYETGGDAEVEKLLASLPDDTDVAKIYDYVHQYGKLPYSQRDYTTVKDTKNWFGGLDNNDVVRDPYDGQTYKLKELAKVIAEQEGITVKEAEELLKKFNGNK